MVVNKKPKTRTINNLKSIIKEIGITSVMFMLIFSCSETDSDLCKKEVPDYFVIEDMDAYFAEQIQTDLVGYKESCNKVSRIDSIAQEKLKIIGQFTVSDYGRYGDECSAILGDLGAKQITTNIRIIDLITRTDFTSSSRLSEVEVPHLLEYEDEFSIYYSGFNDTEIKNAPLDSLNNIDYRISLPNYMIGLGPTLAKGNYELEITYKLETVNLIDTIRLEIY